MHLVVLTTMLEAIRAEGSQYRRGTDVESCIPPCPSIMTKGRELTQVASCANRNSQFEEYVSKYVAPSFILHAILVAPL